MRQSAAVNDVYAVVQVDPDKAYTLADFVGCVRYIGSCNSVKKRYSSTGGRTVPVRRHSSSSLISGA